MVFLLKYWKIAAYGAVIAGLFSAGWLVNGWRLESAWQSEKTERAQAVAEAVSAREKQWRAAQEAQNAEALLISTALADELEEIRIHNELLETRLSDASLIKPNIEMNNVDPINPIGGDFVLLWRVRVN